MCLGVKMDLCEILKGLTVSNKSDLFINLVLLNVELCPKNLRY